MKLRWKFLGLLPLLLGAGAQAATYEVNVFSYFFEPSLLEIRTGDTIEWVAYGAGHIVVSDTEVFNSLIVWGNALPTLGTYRFTFHEPGTFPYYSLEYGGPEGQGMAASVIVTGAPTNQAPRTPTNSLPSASATNQPIRVELRAQSFSDPDGGDLHTASQWIVQRVSDGATVYDSGEVVDNGLGVDSKTSRYLPDHLLNHGTAYAWRVRFKDNFGAWSAYSTPTSFTTIPPALSVTRRGAEMIFSWPANSEGYALVQATNIVSPLWLAATPAPLVIAGQNFVTNTATNGEWFYRLKKT